MMVGSMKLCLGNKLRRKRLQLIKNPINIIWTETLACKLNILFLIMTWMSSLVCSTLHRIIVSTLHYLHSILGDDFIILIKLALFLFSDNMYHKTKEKATIVSYSQLTLKASRTRYVLLLPSINKGSSLMFISKKLFILVPLIQPVKTSSSSKGKGYQN